MLFDLGDPNFSAGISERTDGSMTWWNAKPVDEQTRRNRGAFFKHIGIEPGRVVAGGIAHGTNVGVVGEKETEEYLLDTDALVTNVPNLFLSITAADCLPVYFFDPVSRCVGIAHAGWRGLVAGILENVIKKMEEVYGAEPRHIQTLIGPHIKVCHYKIGAEIEKQFTPGCIDRREDKLFADLTQEAELRLRQASVEKITIDPHCTYCHAARFFSSRHDNLHPVPGMVAYIGIKAN